MRNCVVRILGCALIPRSRIACLKSMRAMIAYEMRRLPRRAQSVISSLTRTSLAYPPVLRANRKVAALRSARNGGTVCKSEHVPHAARKPWRILSTSHHMQLPAMGTVFAVFEFRKMLDSLEVLYNSFDVAPRISNSHDVRRRLRSNLCDLRAGLSQRNSIHIR